MPGSRYKYSDDKEVTPPDYGRAARHLSDAELEDEILRGRGSDAYRAALVAEQEQRARAGAPTDS